MTFDSYNLDITELAKQRCDFCTGAADLKVNNKVLTDRPATYFCKACIQILIKTYSHYKEIGFFK